MADHPNVQKTQASWDANARGDFEPAIASLTPDVMVENGPGAGPWRFVEGRDAFVEFALSFVPLFGDTWKQDGHCIYADDRISISLVHETGTSEASGDTFDNLAIWIARLTPDGRSERLWTIDIDQEACEEFWLRNPVDGAPPTAV
jgi:ketosteroid isomerase-like protein